MQRPAFALAAALLLGTAGPLLLPRAAQAAPAYVTGQHVLHAGPGSEYPVVAQLEPGVMVEVLGCLEGYGWCDAAIGESRGWIPGQFLEAVQRQRRYPLLGIAPSIGVPIIGFSVDSYWGRYYRDRDWYGDRGRWEGRSPPPGFYRGPPPRNYGGPPPHFDRGPPGRPGFDRGPPGRPDFDRGRGGPGPDRGPDRGDRGGDRGGPGESRGQPDRGGPSPDRGNGGGGGPQRGRDDTPRGGGGGGGGDRGPQGDRGGPPQR